MSDCSTRAWKVPNELPAPRRDGSDVLYIETMFERADVEAARAVIVDGVRFVRAQPRDWDEVGE